MHRAFRIVPWAFATVVPLLACKNDDASSSPLDVPEAGSPSVEAGPGGDGGVGPQGGPAKTGVTLTVKKAGAPLPNVRVVFGDQTGALAGETRTDPAGVVTTDGTTHYVTVVLAPDGQVTPSLITYTDVTDGDELLVDIPVKPVAGPPTALGTFSFTWATFNGPSSYEAEVGQCTSGDNDGVFSMPIYSYCAPEGKAPVTGVVRGGSDVGVHGIKYAPRPDVLAPSGGATVAQPTFGSAELRDPRIARVKLIGTNEGTLVASNVDVLVHGAVFAPSKRSGNSNGLEEFLVAPFDGATFIGSVTFEQDPGSIDSKRHMLRRREAPGGPGSGWTGDVELDFSVSDSVGSIKSATATEAETGRPEIVFTVDGPAVPQVALTQLVWFSAGKGGVWWFVSDPKDNRFKGPALPAALAPPADSNYAISAMAFVNSSLYAGHKDAKKTPFDHSARRFLFEKALPKEGMVTFSILGEFYAPK